jgi:nitroimidazol reductase NimA-like FMN-containing flavoprotein (pyridoxamine 5'-phosphate oxidase superfamily)
VRLIAEPLDGFLERPLVGRLASIGASGPAVRPIWYLWEDAAFWWLTGPWSDLGRQLAADPRVALVVDVCDLATGDVKQVVAVGDAELLAYDHERARRLLARYLGPHPEEWDSERFSAEEPAEGTGMVRLQPTRLVARDLSYRPSAWAPGR